MKSCNNCKYYQFIESKPGSSYGEAFCNSPKIEGDWPEAVDFIMSCLKCRETDYRYWKSL